jgi:hypothetical protein
MNRALIFGITIFLAVVGLALVSTGTGTSTAEAGRCCGCHGGDGCHGGCFGGCHGLFHRHSCCGAPAPGCCGSGDHAGPPPVDGGGKKAPPPPPPVTPKAERAPLGFRTVSFQR